MANEFGIKSKEYNKQVLKENWLPVSHYLIYRYVSASKTTPLCNASTVNEEATVLKEEGMRLMRKTKANKSTVVDIKGKVESKENSKNIQIERKTREFKSTLEWQNSPFEEVAALCNADGSKLYSGKSQFRKVLAAAFSSNTTAETGITNHYHHDVSLSDSEKLK